jgi:hypothetical protein
MASHVNRRLVCVTGAEHAVRGLAMNPQAEQRQKLFETC